MRKIGLLGAFCGLLITVVMQTFLANSAPTLVRDWAVDTSGFGWMFASYMLAAAVFIPLSGQLVDRWGARQVCLSGVILFALATVFTASVSGFWFFLAGRLGQGIAAALVGTAALALVTELVPPNQRGRFFGIASSVQASGYLIGPVLGGALIESFGWRIAFAGLGIFAFGTGALLMLAHTGPVRTRSAAKLDWVGAFWCAVSLLALLIFGKTLGSAGANWAVTVSVASIALMAGFLFYRHERGHPHPVIPHALVKLPEYRFSLIACMFIGAMQYSAVAFIPLVAQDVRGSTILQTAWFSLPMVVGGMLGSVLGGRLGERVSTYTVNLIGVSLAASGFLSFAALMSAGHDWMLQAASLAIGIGIAFYYPPQLAVAERVGDDRIGSALALLNTARNVGGALSVSFLTAVMELRAHWRLPDQLALVFGLLACAALGCLLLNHRFNRLAQPAV